MLIPLSFLHHVLNIQEGSYEFKQDALIAGKEPPNLR